MSNLVTVKKSNRVLEVDETQAASYLARGYDQIDKKGKVTKKATSGKTVSIAEHGKVLTELEALKSGKAAATGGASKEEFDKLNAAHQELGTQHDELTLKYDELKEKAEDFAKKGKALSEENDKLKAKLNKQ